MPRDTDSNNRRPPGRRGPPSHGEGRGQRGGRDERPGGRGFRKQGDGFKPREGRAGAPFRKDREGAPRGEGGDRASAKRFGDKRGGDKGFGEKRSFGKRGGSRKDGERAPRREFGRDDRPKRDFRPREDRGEQRDDRRPRKHAPRGSFQRDGDRHSRPDFSRGDDRPQRRDFKPRGERFNRDDTRGEGRSAHHGPRGDFRRSERSDRDRRSGERPDQRDGGKRFERPRGDRPFRGKPRDDRRDVGSGGDRPRFSRDRGERPQEGQTRQDRPRNDRVSRSSHAWRDHPKSEDFEARGDRNYERRPAFGGRGEYRERKPGRDSRRRETAEATPPRPGKTGDRIAKLMARAGLCSRRDAEEWIRQGRVSVNGRVIASPALDVTSHDKVLVDGAPLPERERTRLFLYHKPKGLVTTHADPEGRPTVFESLPEGLPRLISIGRLDFNTEGLLLLTNDGGLARVLELPDTGWLRRYRVRAHGTITQERLDELRKGVEVDGVKYGPIEATLERDQGANVWLLFAIREGKNREVRNVMAHLGLEVNRLIRVSYGPFQLGELAEGQVEEVRSRMLRDQLGERIAAAAGADFGLPARESGEGTAGSGGEQPRKRAGLIADRKGRRVLVERSGRDEQAGDRPRRKPAGGYKGKRGRTRKEDS